ncbi:RapZ C-terminal domain-containing protein [Streptosporangium sp. OZ121]|uniref:RapZ C-terminal domain-containing protein n=1 Tax=Streptosporangium sp. OZ121 TaxID=3444183 RepID=UPI003F7AB3CE
MQGTTRTSVSANNPPEDPEVRERMVQLTGLDPEVRAYVLDTPGALEIVSRTADQLRTLVEHWGNPTRRIVHAHVYCREGRHRSVAVAEEVAVWLREAGYGVEVDHLDITNPVVA